MSVTGWNSQTMASLERPEIGCPSIAPSSVTQLERICGKKGQTSINPFIYAYIYVSFDSISLGLAHTPQNNK